MACEERRRPSKPEVMLPREREGDEVVEVYLTFPQSPGAPIRALRGFSRIQSGAGKSAKGSVYAQPARPQPGE